MFLCTPKSIYLFYFNIYLFIYFFIYFFIPLSIPLYFFISLLLFRIIIYFYF